MSAPINVGGTEELRVLHSQGYPGAGVPVLVDDEHMVSVVGEELEVSVDAEEAPAPAVPAAALEVNSNNDSYPCPSCADKVFVSMRALNNHRAKVHKEKVIPHCEVCGLEFPTTSKLGIHRRKKHPQHAKERAAAKKHEGGILCGLCKTTFSSMTLLCKHLKDAHKESALIEHREFADWAEFEAWKRELETTDRCRYARKQGSVIVRKFHERHYFDCHRSGRPKLLSQAERMSQRANKLHPTCKVGFNCSAHIYASVGTTDEDRRVSVAFCRHHYGHDHGLHWLPIPEALRERIMDLLQAGASREDVYAQVVQEAQEAAARGEPGAERTALVNRHDIANIEHQLQFKAAREEKRRLRDAEKRRREEAERERWYEKTRQRAATRERKAGEKRRGREGNESPSEKRAKLQVKFTSDRRVTRSGRRTNFGENMERLRELEAAADVDEEAPSTSADHDYLTVATGGGGIRPQVKAEPRRSVRGRGRPRRLQTTSPLQLSHPEAQASRGLVLSIRRELATLDKQLTHCGRDGLATLLHLVKELGVKAAGVVASEAERLAALTAPAPLPPPEEEEDEGEEEEIQVGEVEAQPHPTPVQVQAPPPPPPPPPTIMALVVEEEEEEEISLAPLEKMHIVVCGPDDAAEAAHPSYAAPWH